MAAPEEWTVEEANAALPRVRALLQRARDGAVTLPVAVEALAADGILLRDPVRGLIDFAAVASEGRRYWLCWVDGEDEVGWWHWVEDGFAGRQPLATPPT